MIYFSFEDSLNFNIKMEIFKDIKNQLVLSDTLFSSFRAVGGAASCVPRLVPGVNHVELLRSWG